MQHLNKQIIRHLLNFPKLATQRKIEMIYSIYTLSFHSP